MTDETNSLEMFKNMALMKALEAEWSKNGLEHKSTVEEYFSEVLEPRDSGALKLEMYLHELGLYCTISFIPDNKRAKPIPSLTITVTGEVVTNLFKRTKEKAEQAKADAIRDAYNAEYLPDDPAILALHHQQAMYAITTSDLDIQRLRDKYEEILATQTHFFTSKGTK